MLCAVCCTHLQNKAAYGTAKQHPVWKTLSLKTAASLVTLHDYYTLIPEARWVGY